MDRPSGYFNITMENGPFINDLYQNGVFFIATLRGEEQWLMVTGIEMIVATTVTQSWILILISTSLIMIIFIHLNIDLSLIMDDIFILDIKINNQ